MVINNITDVLYLLYDIKYDMGKKKCRFKLSWEYSGGLCDQIDEY